MAAQVLSPTLLVALGILALKQIVRNLYILGPDFALHGESGAFAEERTPLLQHLRAWLTRGEHPLLVDPRPWRKKALPWPVPTRQSGVILRGAAKGPVLHRRAERMINVRRSPIVILDEGLNQLKLTSVGVDQF